MEAKQYLRKAYRLHELIESEQAELDALRELAQSVSSSSVSDMPKSPTMNGEAPYEKHVIKMVDLEAKIKRQIQEYISLEEEIREVINNVEDNEEKLLLRNRYILFMEWEDIYDKMHLSKRSVHRIHASALKNINIPERWH